MSERVEDALQQATKSLQRLMSAAKDVEVAREKAGFFSLPAELRNKIMDLVLVPGDVYLRLPASMAPYHYMSNPSIRSQFRLGAQLLATNRQAYNEGRAKYYSMNRFHFPSLSASDCQCILNRYQIRNLEMVRHFTLGCYITQLSNKDMVQNIEEKIGPLINENGRLSHRLNPLFYGICIQKPLYTVWKEKLLLIRRIFPHLDSLVILREIMEYEYEFEIPGAESGSENHESMFEQLVFQGSCAQEEFERLGNLNGLGLESEWNVTSLYMIFTAARVTSTKIESRLDEVGWEKTKQWLLTGGEINGLELA